MRIAKVDGDASGHGEVHMASHLMTLIPGDRASELVGQLLDRLAHSPLDVHRRVTVPEVQEEHEAGRALDQGAHRRLVSDPYTKLLGPAKWTWFYLYVIIEIFSRYVPGWMLARAGNGKLAEIVLAETITKQEVGQNQLTIQSERGSPITAEPGAFLLADLGDTMSFSRSHVSVIGLLTSDRFVRLETRGTPFGNPLEIKRPTLPGSTRTDGLL